MRACKLRTVELEVGLFFKTKALQKVPPGDQSSAIRKADKPPLTLLGIKCGVDSPPIRSQSISHQIYSAFYCTQHFGHWTKPQSGMQRAALSRAAGISIEPESVAT